LTAKIANDVFGAQANFSTTQQLVSSSTDPQKQTYDIFKYAYFFKQSIFRGRNARWLLAKFVCKFYEPPTWTRACFILLWI